MPLSGGEQKYRGVSMRKLVFAASAAAVLMSYSMVSFAQGKPTTIAPKTEDASKVQADKAKAEEEARAEAEAEAKAKAEAKLKAEDEARAAAIADAEARVEVEADAKATAEVEADANAKVEEEAKLVAETEAEARAARQRGVGGGYLGLGAGITLFPDQLTEAAFSVGGAIPSKTWSGGLVSTFNFHRGKAETSYRWTVQLEALLPFMNRGTHAFVRFGWGIMGVNPDSNVLGTDDNEYAAHLVGGGVGVRLFPTRKIYIEANLGLYGEGGNLSGEKTANEGALWIPFNVLLGYNPGGI